MLSFINFFDRQEIPQELIRIRKELTESGANATNTDNNEADNYNGNGSESTINDKFENNISTLRNYSFIMANADSTTFEMYSLMQLATRN